MRRKVSKNALVGFNINSATIKNKDLTDKIWPDAFKNGDCLFKANKYKDAMGFYDEAYSQKTRWICICHVSERNDRRIDGRTIRKNTYAEDVKTQYPNSDFADDALLQLGDTYFELKC
ncbi:MAG: hypothetical protein IPJ51_19965 [Saprospiraceae bacterium]|nr:hypothetical protein [Saprospiraceae bacterium]